VAARRGLPLEDVAPAGMMRARRESEALAASAGTAREGTA
jgi:small subunit ribosomal protein S5